MNYLQAGLALFALASGSAAFGSTAAFVYQSADVPNTNSSVQAIYGYALSSTGQLTPIPGQPFGVGDGINYYTACNGTYFFGISWGNPKNATWQNIVTYRIASNGALTKVQTTAAAKLSSTPGPHYLYGPLALDHSGQFLYVGVTGGSDLYSQYSVMTFQVNHESGALDFLGEAPFHGQDTMTIHFTGKGQYAFDENDYEYLVAGNKTLRLLGNATDAGFNGNYLDPDPLSNLAVLGKNGQLQSWFVHANGDLSQHSSDGQTLVHTNLWPNDYRQMYFSPDGSILALAGFGLDLYHFNGAEPITNFKQLHAPGVFNSQLDRTVGTWVSIVGWDNQHHFLTITQDNPQTGNPGPLYWEIYTATSSSVTQAYRAVLPNQSYYGFAVQRLGTSPKPID
ncbi:MAG TPA: hypothetical protein VMU71_02110 [Terracidiphilus sp.]|nr:hypothetical protein [Terracidiphilus sp.]